VPAARQLPLANCSKVQAEAKEEALNFTLVCIDRITSLPAFSLRLRLQAKSKPKQPPDEQEKQKQQQQPEKLAHSNSNFSLFDRTSFAIEK